MVRSNSAAPFRASLHQNNSRVLSGLCVSFTLPRSFKSQLLGSSWQIKDGRYSRSLSSRMFCRTYLRLSTDTDRCPSLEVIVFELSLLALGNERSLCDSCFGCVLFWSQFCDWNLKSLHKLKVWQRRLCELLRYCSFFTNWMLMLIGLSKDWKTVLLNNHQKISAVPVLLIWLLKFR